MSDESWSEYCERKAKSYAPFLEAILVAGFNYKAAVKPYVEFRGTSTADPALEVTISGIPNEPHIRQEYLDALNERFFISKSFNIREGAKRDEIPWHWGVRDFKVPRFPNTEDRLTADPQSSFFTTDTVNDYNSRAGIKETDSTISFCIRRLDYEKIKAAYLEQLTHFLESKMREIAEEIEPGAYAFIKELRPGKGFGITVAGLHHNKQYTETVLNKLGEALGIDVRQKCCIVSAGYNDEFFISERAWDEVRQAFDRHIKNGWKLNADRFNLKLLQQAQKELPALLARALPDAKIETELFTYFRIEPDAVEQSDYPRINVTIDKVAG